MGQSVNAHQVCAGTRILVCLFIENSLPGGHLVVQKANRNGRRVAFGRRLGPLKAVDAFLEVHMDFAREDELGKRNFFASHRHGWLVRAMQMQRTKIKERRMKTLRRLRWVTATRSSA